MWLGRAGRAPHTLLSATLPESRPMLRPTLVARPVPLFVLLVALSIGLVARAQDLVDGVDDEPPALVEPEPVRDSLFSGLLFLGDEPPPTRSVRHIQLVHTEALGAARNVGRTREEALELAASLRRALVEGADFDQLARAYSSAQDAPLGGVLGSFAPNVLQQGFDEFLFDAEPWEISQPIDAPTGIHLLQRIDRLAGCLTLMVQGTEDESLRRVEALREEILAGAAFEDVARRASQDPITAERGGALAVFERGPADRLLKAAVFRLREGEVSRPVRTPYGWHLLKRVAPDALPAEVVEQNWMEFRGILVLHDQHTLPIVSPPRSPAEAEAKAAQLAAQLDEGADFGDLAAEHTDDPGGARQRRGRVGWVHRRQPGLPPFMRQVFRLEVGDYAGPQLTNIGWVLVERTR